jgi:hypothetical protein
MMLWVVKRASARSRSTSCRMTSRTATTSAAPDWDGLDVKRKPSALAFVSGSLARDRQGPSIAPSRAGRVRLLEFDCLSAVRSDRTDSMRVSMLAPTLASTHARYR